MKERKIETALISVFNKDGIVEFARALVELGVAIISSGGTAKKLDEAGIPVTDVASLVGGGAILGHRVVTLSREIHAGLLARNIPEDVAELERLGIKRIDLVCCDMYPLEQAIIKPDATLDSIIEMTDIGGPTMIRSAAKGRRVVICDPNDRAKAISWMRSGMPDADAFVGKLCAKAEYVVSRYCMLSAKALSLGLYEGFSGRRASLCKYGENAHQGQAALYTNGNGDPLGLDRFTVIEGDALSYNNQCDIDRLLQTITHIAAAFDKDGGHVPAIALGAKHGNCCGACIDFKTRSSPDAVRQMMLGDPLAIFGGIVMLNFPVTHDVAEALAGKMLDGIVAPRFGPSVADILKRKKGKCRLVMNPALESLGADSLDTAPRFRYVRGGFLQQPNYTYVPDLKGSVIVRHTSLGPIFEDDMLLAWAIGSTSNSNTITIVKEGMLLANAVGQQDRVGAAKLAIERARRSRHDLKGSVAYSDSFFPFPDGPEALIEAGVCTIFTSSGSVNDSMTIELCLKKKVGLYMVPDAKGRGFFGH